MPVEGISMTTVFSLLAVGIALALSTYIGSYYLRPIFDIDALLTSVAYDIATLYDLAYTLPGEVTMQYFGPSACKWNYNKAGNDVSSFYCIDPSSVVIKTVNVNKQYLIVYDDIYLNYDSHNSEINNWIFNYMNLSSMAKAIGYPRISYLVIELPYYNRRISKQTDFESGKIGYGSLAVAPFAGSYTDNAMTAAATPYPVEIVNHSFVVSKTKVGSYYYTLSNYQYTPIELSTFANYLTGVYNTICNTVNATSGYYIFPVYTPKLVLNATANKIYDGINEIPLIDNSQAATAHDYLKQMKAFLMISKGNKINAYDSAVSYEKIYDAWTFDNGPYSSLNNNDLTVHGATLIDSLFGKAYYFNGNSYLEVLNSGAVSQKFMNNEFSVSAWVNLEKTTNDNSTIISKSSQLVNGYTLYLGKDDNLFRFCIFDLPDKKYCAISDEPAIKNRWYHLTGVFNGTHALLYVDSELNLAVSGTIYPHVADNFMIGKGSNSGYFNGLIDDVKYFDSALSQLDVNMLYSSMSKSNLCSENVMLTLDGSELYNELYGYWNFNFDNGGLEVLSSIGKDNLHKNAAALIDNQNNNFLMLGKNGGSNINSHLSSSIKPSFSEFSISFYIKPTTTGKYQYIVSTNNGSCNDECSEIIGYSIRFNPENKIEFIFANSFYEQDIITSNYQFDPLSWTQVIVTFNQGIARIYINGELDSEKSTSVYYIPEPFFNLTIGALAYDAPNYYPYNGWLDEIKIFSKELSSAEANYVYSNPESLVINEFLETIKINDYFINYCFDINELTRMKQCENIKDVEMSADFIDTINSETNYYAGWNSCIYPYLFYDSVSKKLVLKAINSDYNIIAGGCILNE
ncbi:MAG: LamG domain-containing protein [Candidatus Nanoarchaeia archaeon]|jgi:hypothetical protein